MEEEEGTLVEQEGERRTPLHLASKEREDIENINKECCESNNHVTIKLWRQMWVTIIRIRGEIAWYQSNHKHIEHTSM